MNGETGDEETFCLDDEQRWSEKNLGQDVEQSLKYKVGEIEASGVDHKINGLENQKPSNELEYEELKNGLSIEYKEELENGFGDDFLKETCFYDTNRCLQQSQVKLTKVKRAGSGKRRKKGDLSRRMRDAQRARKRRLSLLAQETEEEAASRRAHIAEQAKRRYLAKLAQETEEEAAARRIHHAEKLRLRKLEHRAKKPAATRCVYSTEQPGIKQLTLRAQETEVEVAAGVHILGNRLNKVD